MFASNKRGLSPILLGLMLGWRVAAADTTPTLFNSFAGNINFIGTQKTLRTQPDGGNPCLINAGATTATLAGLPAGATIRAAYLYWAGSGSTPDYSVTFEGNAITATAARSYTATFVLGSTYNYFSGAFDVTGIVAAKGNGTYSFAGLTVNNGDPWCGSSAVLGGWAVLVIYSYPSEDFRVINVYEGFQAFRGSAITLTPGNFQIPVSPINGKDAHLTWEGDVGNSSPLGGFNEQLTFNGNTLTDASNPVNNQFNSVSTINSPADTASYGVDFDVYDVSAYLAAGQTSATTVYSSGGDLVLLSAQIISTTNEPVADLEISMTRNGDLTPGQNATYTLDVINNGPLNESGPVSVVDTLPAGLGYVSGSGTGWTCGAAGQVVTCNYSGSLGSGVAAPALTLTVAVSAGASGTITNTATVDGQAFDNISWNNTATDSFYVLPSPYAYYAMEEVSWGAVLDSSGNGRNASNLGSGAPTGNPPPSPPGSAIAGTPGTCGAGSIPGTAGTQAVDTAIDVNSIGNAGTIAFWYYGGTAWNDGTSRMLLDASNDLGGGGADKNFYLVKEGGGQLRFEVEDSADTNTSARTGGFSFAAGTWVHIAVTWDMAADRTQVYVNGTLEITSTTNVNGTLGNTDTLYLGDNRSGAIGGAPAYTTNSANGFLDEVRLYSTALSAGDIAAARNLTHSCSTLDHIQIEHGSGGGLTCNPGTLTVRACADAACSAFYTGGVTGTLTVTGPPPTVNWVGGSGFTIASGSSTVTKDFQVTTPGSVVLGTSGENPMPGTPTTCNFGAPSCTFTAADSGFVFDVPHHTAATTQSVTVSAVRKDDVTQRCVPAFQSVTKTVNFWSTYLNPGTGTLAVNVNGTNIAGASPGTGISLNFDANGEVMVPVSYADVGQMRLDARHSGAGDAAGLVMTGQDNFVTKPARFILTIPGNPAAADALGAIFKGAGENFTINVEAQNASNAITPNYGRESAAETVLLTKALVAPAGGNNPALGGGFGAFGQDCSGGPAAGGTACGTFNWPEVGIITLTPGIGDGDYLGAGDTSGTVSGNVGRFIPHHFDVTKIHGCTGGAAFTYSGQAFGMVTATARNLAGTTTSNYHDFGGGVVFSKDTTLSDAGASANFTNNVIAAAGFTNGIGNQGNVIYTFPARETVPLTLTLRAVDTDNVSSSGYTEETAEVRSGRVRIVNAYGSELVSMAVPMRVEYYSTDGWVTNTTDTCTSVPATSLSLANGTAPTPVSPPTAKTIGTRTTSATVANSPFLNGDAGLSFSAPGAGGEGYVDVTPDLTTQTWLRYDWNGDSTEDDPTGRATFGLYRGSPKSIYLKERY